MQLIWRDRARADLRDLYIYLFDRNAIAAGRIRATIESRIDLLADQPGIGRRGRSPGTRELVVPRTPYIVTYSVDQQADEVVILRIIHGARGWPDTLT